MAKTKGLLLITFWLLALPFAFAQNITDFKKVTPTVQYKKQGGMTYCQLTHGQLGVQVAMDETTCDYSCWAAIRFTQNGKPVGGWFSLGKSVPENELFLYYSESAKAYYIIDDIEADDAEIFELYYVTPNSAVFEGMYPAKNGPAYDAYYNVARSEPVINILRTADIPQLSLTFGADKKVLEFEKYVSSPEESQGYEGQEALNKKATAFNWQKGFTPTLTYSRAFDLMADGEPEKFNINWTKKEITYANTDAMLLIKEGKAKDYIRFSGDTLLVTAKNKDGLLPGSYTYYFTVSEKYNTAVVSKFRYPAAAKGCTGEDFYPLYKEVTYALEGFELYGEYTFCHMCFGRKLTLKDLHNRLKNKNLANSFDSPCITPPGYMEIQALTEENPITPDNVQVYNDIAFYISEIKPVNDKSLRNIQESSLHLLGQITHKFPDRAVAWLNLADVYWSRNENYKKQAVDAYKKYLGLMKAQGKDLNKVPQRVYDRIK